MTENELFLAVLDLPDEAARAEYLDRVCDGDPARRGRIESLLRSHDSAGSFLGVPVAVVPDPDAIETAFNPLGGANGDAAAASHREDEEELRSLLAPSTRPDSLGRLGHYEVLQVLGRGGFGVVFRAFDDVLQRIVAIKMMTPQMAATSPARKRFLREARASAAVRHENVVQVYEVGEKPLPYLVMEFIPGETLQNRIDRHGPLDVRETLQIAQQIAEGLAAAHLCDLIHRDIKPGNVLLEGGAPRVKITDFGLARTADDASMTQSGVIAGTPLYMAPEQALGHSLDQRADLFSFGSVLYQMVTGRPPFRAGNTLAVMKRVAEDTPRPIREVIPETPQWLCNIISKLHAKRREDRYDSAREVAAVLADCEAKLKTGSRPKDFTSIPLGKPVRSRGRKWATIAALVLVPLIPLIVTEIAGVTHLLRPRPAAPAPVAAVGDVPPKAGTLPEPAPYVAGGGANTALPTRPTTVPTDAAGWTVLTPSEMNSQGGATLTIQGDRSVLASGVHPDLDTYTLTFHPMPLPRIRSLRIEALPHPSLPNGGSSRKSTHFSVLTRVRAALQHPGPDAAPPRELVLAKAWADTASGVDAVPAFTIDNLDETGWAFEGSRPHALVLELEAPVAVPSGMALRVSLEFKHHDLHGQIGHFRVSAVRDADAQSAADDWLARAVPPPPAGVAPFTGADVQRIAALPAAEQVEEVRKALKQLNPTFDGTLTPTIQDGVVTKLTLTVDDVENLAPLRALRGLTLLDCSGSNPNRPKVKLADLSPLRGMPLTSFRVAYCPLVRDLSPLMGMSLVHLDVTGTNVESIDVAALMPLTVFSADRAPIADLSPLSGRILHSLHIGGSRVKSLAEVPAASVEFLLCYPDQIPNDADLQRLNVRQIQLWGVPNTIDPARLRAMQPRLQRVMGKSVEEFLKGIEAGKPG